MTTTTKQNPPGHAPRENPKTVPFGDENIPIGEKVARVRAVFDSVAPKYDLMNDITSLGAHRIWKAAAIDRLMPRPAMRVVDVAGGTADMAMRIAERVGTDAMSQAGGHISVMDINPAMMEIGQGRVKQAQMADTIDFTCANGEALPLDDSSVDAYIIAFGLRNITNPEQALAEARRVLAPGGHFLCLEFSHPKRCPWDAIKISNYWPTAKLKMSLALLVISTSRFAAKRVSSTKRTAPAATNVPMSAPSNWSIPSSEG